MTVSLDKLGSTWRRGSAFKAHVPRSSNYIFVKFVLDCDGIKAVDLLPSIPKYRPQQTYGLWYILEKFSRLRDLCVVQQVCRE